jgi:ATP-dependent DNA helicase RecQ
VCNDEVAQVADPLVVGQKILSCVARLEQRFGADYTAKVLSGSAERAIMERRHDSLSTYGLLSVDGYGNVRDWIEQLVGQGYMVKHGEYQVLRITQDGVALLKGQATPKLAKPRPRPSGGSSRGAGAAARGEGWEGVDRPLFEDLRSLRRECAEAAHVPAYMVFSDATLREMARRRPSTPSGMRQVKGVGDRKLAEYGKVFVDRIVSHCRAHLLGMDRP